jgi:hypothetical protein
MIGAKSIKIATITVNMEVKTQTCNVLNQFYLRKSFPRVAGCWSYQETTDSIVGVFIVRMTRSLRLPVLYSPHHVQELSVYR